MPLRARTCPLCTCSYIYHLISSCIIIWRSAEEKIFNFFFWINFRAWRFGIDGEKNNTRVYGVEIWCFLYEIWVLFF